MNGQTMYPLYDEGTMICVVCVEGSAGDENSVSHTAR